MRKSVIVNTDQCIQVGQALKDISVRPGFAGREFISFEADRETKLRIYFLSVAICHQTRNLYNSKLNLWGWDYIEYAFLQMFRKNHPIINPGYVAICNIKDMAAYLLEAFSPDGNRENSTLDRIEERAGMLLDICQIVRSRYNRNISDLIDSCNGRLIDNGKGLYEVLPQFLAFSDPLRKKITFFLKLSSDAGLIRIKDPDNTIPIMDYHMQRVLLRSGCVEIADENLKQKIIAKSMLSSDELIRKSCIDAIKIIAEYSGNEPAKMNDFFWPLGRSCCNESMLCQIRTCAKNPCSLMQIINLDSHHECLLEKSCKGATAAEYRLLWEPIVETHYY